MPAEDLGATDRLIPAAWPVIGAILALAGCIAFLLALESGYAMRAWQAYLVNFVFWTGLAFGAVLFSAVLNMADASWGRPMKRFSEAFSWYLPVSFCLFWGLYAGRGRLFPWAQGPVEGAFKQMWLRTWFVFARNGTGLAVLTALCLTLVYYSIKGDRRRTTASADVETSGMNGKGTIVCWRAQKVLSPVIGIVYALVLSLVAFDLIMSLDAHWYSTLFGGYYFIGSFYSGLAALYLLSLLCRDRTTLKEYLHQRQFHDMGKLVMAFTLFTGYLFYAQFFVIWYGNIPEETRYLIHRFRLPPWEQLGWLILAMILLVPFFVFLSRKIKTRRPAMIVLCLIVLAGMWLERFIFVVPSLWKGPAIPIGPLEALITGGFLGMVMLTVTLFLRKVPLVPVSDPLFHKFLDEREERLRP
jgi:hypothetical protein